MALLDQMVVGLVRACAICFGYLFKAFLQWCERSEAAKEATRRASKQARKAAKLRVHYEQVINAMADPLPEIRSASHSAVIRPICPVCRRAVDILVDSGVSQVPRVCGACRSRMRE